MKKRAVKKKSKGKPKLRLINFKATEKEFAAIKKVASLYAHGNVSGVIRLIVANPALLKSNRVRVKRAA